VFEHAELIGSLHDGAVNDNVDDNVDDTSTYHYRTAEWARTS
jgi:hypothetical protein